MSTLSHMIEPNLVVAKLLKTLESDGIVQLPTLLRPDQLAGMQRAFAARLKRLRWNDFEGYEQTELYRHMIHDVLTLDQGFVDLALHHGVEAPYFRLAAPMPESVPNPGCTLTTPNCRSSTSRCAAIIQMKLMLCPGAATFGW